jgi:hypothetical protein
MSRRFGTGADSIALFSLRAAIAAWGAFVLIVFAMCAAIALSGCAGGFSAAPSAGSQQMVYSAESDFAAALRVAVAYEALPTCSATQKFPCSDPSAVTKLTAAARAARASLTTAEAAVRSSTNAAALTTAAIQAQSDVAAFKALAASFGSK